MRRGGIWEEDPLADIRNFIVPLEWCKVGQNIRPGCKEKFCFHLGKTYSLIVIYGIDLVMNLKDEEVERGSPSKGKTMQMLLIKRRL